MNKTDLVKAVAKATGHTAKTSEEAVDAILDGITRSLSKGKEARFVGFGSFYISKRKATKGRNPRTGEVINIKASKLPRFRPGQALKDTLN